jgi:transposase IS116/IS110/IS902 family protein
MALQEPHVERLSRDLRDAASTLSDAEARFLVDAYYLIQEDRKRSGNQVRAMKDEPHRLLAWFFDQNEMLESQIKAALDKYSSSKAAGRWMKSIYGIGPVISAGLLAHIDIHKAVTAGHIYRFAGLDPTVKWEKGKKRPFNAGLKVLCWKIGQSFMKFSGADECFYGKLYRKRKEFEIERNERGYNKDRAADLLPKFDKKTEAYKHLLGGKLPPAQIDAMARRWTVKLFLSHLQTVWYELEHGKPPPMPFAIAMQGHAHYVPPPNWPMQP